MPGPPPVPVQGDPDLPERVDVVIIGGGIIGVSTALELAERGHKVALCEKGGIGHEQSSRNWGWVRISLRDEREIPLMAEAAPHLAGTESPDRPRSRLYANGHCLRLHQPGSGRAPSQVVGTSPAVPDQERRLNASEFAEVLPGCTIGYEGALFTPADAVQNLRWRRPPSPRPRGTRARPSSPNAPCAAWKPPVARSAGWSPNAARSPATPWCLAGGAWSRLFAGNLGIELPQLKVMNTVVRTEPLTGGPDSAFWAEDIAFRKREDGGYTIADGSLNIVDIVPDSFRLALKFLPALRHQWRDLRLRLGGRFNVEAGYARSWALDEVTPFEKDRVLDPVPHHRSVETVLSRAAAVFPVFSEAKMAQAWAGLIDVTPDAIPVISPVDSVPGFHIATGFSGHGFGIGPAAGRLMADIVTDRHPVCRRGFRFSRFFDGSRMVPRRPGYEAGR